MIWAIKKITPFWCVKWLAGCLRALPAAPMLLILSGQALPNPGYGFIGLVNLFLIVL